LADGSLADAKAGGWRSTVKFAIAGGNEDGHVTVE
jgi:hypothetical protein